MESAIEKPAIEILQPAWTSLVSSNIDALMSLRAGGISSGPYGDVTGVGGFNVGLYVGDVPMCVNMNRNLAAQLVPSDPKWLKQTHGAVVVDAETCEAEAQADASVSMTPNVVCVVQTADCLPLLLTDTEGKIVAAVHVSWRSLAAGIVQNTIAHMQKRLGNDAACFVAWLGPRIGEKDYEVGQDVFDALSGLFDGAQEAFAAQGEGKYLCDLGALTIGVLTGLGVQEDKIINNHRSTVADPELFYSYRRDTTTGRHATMIWIKDEQ